MQAFHLLGGYWWIIVIVIGIALYKVLFRIAMGGVIIPQDSLGVVTKKWVLLGAHKTLPDGRIIALKGEAGVQVDTLAPGLHLFYWLWQYKVSIVKFVTIDEGEIGVVEARDGNPLPAGRVLARAIDCDSFQDARKFLENGGERGPQMAIIPPGTYRINSGLFEIRTSPALQIPDNMVGIVTTREGKPLPTGDIAGKETSGHNMFQNGQAFVDNGGYKGLQEQVILAGLYYVNPNFATVEMKPMTEVPIGYVGVVVAYIGDEAPAIDGTATSVKDRQIRVVAKGQKGVWSTPLDPGKYPINPYTHLVENVPTTNIVLNWATNKSEAHELDKNLSSITVRSKDGFKFNLDVSQIIHVPRENAPRVIARFGTMINLVTQVLEPSIGNYYRNGVQAVTVIEFLSARSQQQEAAKKHIQDALNEYDVQAVDTLIGDIATPDELMQPLKDRMIAEQQKTTYAVQTEAQDARQKLQESTSLANTMAQVVDSKRQIEIRRNEADAKIETARGDAKSKTINAEADAEVLTVTGDAEGKKITAVGEAEASVLKKKGEALNPQVYAGIEIARALSESGFKLVPDMVVSGGTNAGSGSSIMDALLALMVKKEMSPTPVAAPALAKEPADTSSEVAGSKPITKKDRDRLDGGNDGQEG